MATFTNQAALSYSGNTVLSNIVVGEFLETFSATKNVSGTGYTEGEDLTYVIALRNAGGTALTGLTVTDTLGAYTPVGGTTAVTPLTYVPGSVLVYVDGVLQAAPATVTAGPPLVIDTITVPAGGDTVIVYRATPNQFAPLAPASSITNTASITGASGIGPVIVTDTVSVTDAADLAINKRVEPTPVEENGTLTYTFIITNTGNTGTTAGDSVVLTDVLNPILTNLTVTYDGTLWTEGVQYTYDQGTGTLTTTAGAINVGPATYTQNPATGVITTTPGTTTLIVSGTI